MINTTHFEYMLKEREIQSEWVERTVSEPDYLEDHPDGRFQRPIGPAPAQQPVQSEAPRNRVY